MLSDVSAVSALAPSTPAVPKPAAKIDNPSPLAPSPSPHASPVSLLDASTGLVVMEFYNAKGEETASLPTKKQLDLYRLNEPSPDIFQPAIRDITAPPTQA